MKNIWFKVVSCLLIFSIGAYLIWRWDDRNLISYLNDKRENGDYYADFNLAVDSDWELVCDSHPYDGPLYLKKYDRTYEPVAWSQDSAWGLLFIDKNGDYFAITGSESDGVDFHNLGCLPRDKAKFEFDVSRKAWIPIKSAGS